MKTMKKAKAPSAKTLERKAKEAALIAWAKQQQAQFRADLREMFAKEKRERLGMKESVGTGNTTKRLVLQAPGLENRPPFVGFVIGRCGEEGRWYVGAAASFAGAGGGSCQSNGKGRCGAQAG